VNNQRKISDMKGEKKCSGHFTQKSVFIRGFYTITIFFN